MMLVAVGTYIHGFDELVGAADQAAASLGVAGFAQIGHSRVVPRHLAWERFLTADLLAQRLTAARVIVCHSGVGLLGEAMRAGKPIIAVPRRGRPTRDHPAGDQTELVRRLAERHPIAVCEHLPDLPALLRAELEHGPATRSYDLDSYDLDSDVPQLVARFLVPAG